MASWKTDDIVILGSLFASVAVWAYVARRFWRIQWIGALCTWGFGAVSVGVWCLGAVGVGVALTAAAGAVSPATGFLLGFAALVAFCAAVEAAARKNAKG